MMLRCTAVIVALLLFAGEGLCTSVCAPEPTPAQPAHAGTLPPCHQTDGAAPEPGAPAQDHECSGPCAASLTAAGPELPGQAFHAALMLPLAEPPLPAHRTRAPAAHAAERLPPRPARFLLHASFLI